MNRRGRLYKWVGVGGDCRFYYWHSQYAWLNYPMPLVGTKCGQFWDFSILGESSRQVGIRQYGLMPVSEFEFLTMVGQTLDKTLKKFERGSHE